MNRARAFFAMPPKKARYVGLRQLPELGWRITLVSDAEEATAAATAALKAAEEAADLRKWKAVEAESEPECILTDLPADVVQHIVVRLTLAHHIARAAPTCKVVSVAARNAMKVRPFSGEVVALAGHTDAVLCVAAAPDVGIVTGSDDSTVKVWRGGACERTIQAHASWVNSVAVMPGGARFVSGSPDRTVKQWTLDGALERTFEVDNIVQCVAALPTAKVRSRAPSNVHSFAVPSSETLTKRAPPGSTATALTQFVCA